MKSYAIIENGIVINTAVAEGAWPFPEQHAIEIPDGVGVAIGDSGDPATWPAPVVSPEPPSPPTVKAPLTPLQFFDRFTDEEQLAIVTATMQVPQVKLWYDKLIAATSVVEEDPRLATGLDALVAFGLLAAERRAMVLPVSTNGMGVM